ncbi:hypothetical protein D3C78_1698120 [compost metagenome]
MCAVRLIKSTGRAWRSIGSLPVAWAASTWKMMPFSRHRAPMRSMSCTTPISLFTSMTLARMVSGRMAALNTSKSSRPLSCTSR